MTIAMQALMQAARHLGQDETVFLGVPFRPFSTVRVV
jgi:hypothetical protein